MRANESFCLVVFHNWASHLGVGSSSEDVDRPHLLQYELPLPSCRELPAITACPVTGRVCVFDGNNLLMFSCERGPIELLATLYLSTFQGPITLLSLYASHLAISSERECVLLRVKLWPASKYSSKGLGGPGRSWAGAAGESPGHPVRGVGGRREQHQRHAAGPERPGALADLDRAID